MIPAYAGRALEGRGVGGDAYRIVPKGMWCLGGRPEFSWNQAPQKGEMAFFADFHVVVRQLEIDAIRYVSGGLRRANGSL